MKKKVFFTGFLQILLVLSILSCKSTPRTTTPPSTTQSGGASQALLNTLRDATDNAAEARKRAVDFESPQYFPSDWDAAERQYSSAGNLPRSTDAEVQQAINSFNASADAYNELFRKTIPLYAQAREDEIITARDALIATGLAGTFPEYLQKPDDISLLALSQYEEEKYYEARDTAAKALTEYELLNIGANAYLTRQRIINLDFTTYDPENFDKADEIGLAALDEFESGNYVEAKDLGEEALLRYNLVLSAGWMAYASGKRDSANSEREHALFLKANIAVRDFFRDADVIFNQAEAALMAEQYENAAINYTESEVRFVLASRDTEEKRRIADEVIKEAEEKIEESDETARHAEIIIEGGER